MHLDVPDLIPANDIRLGDILSHGDRTVRVVKTEIDVGLGACKLTVRDINMLANVRPSLFLVSPTRIVPRLASSLELLIYQCEGPGL